MRKDKNTDGGRINKMFVVREITAEERYVRHADVKPCKLSLRNAM